MYHSNNTMRGAIEKPTTKGYKNVWFKRPAAFILCAALMASTVPMETFAAQDTALEAEESSPNTENLWFDTTDEEIPSDTIALSGEIIDENVSHESNAPSCETSGTDDSQESGNPSDEIPDMNDSQENNDLSSSQNSASRVPGITLNDNVDAYAGSEAQLEPTWPSDEYDDETGVLTIYKGASTEILFTVKLPGNQAQDPILQITIPSCMNFSDYPQNMNNLKSVEETEGNDSHILTYQFTSNVTTLEFTIKTIIPANSPITDGGSYSVRLDYYDGTSLLDSDMASFTAQSVEHPSRPNTIRIDHMDKTQSSSLQEGQTTYELGAYSWRLSAKFYSAYDSITMTVPLPENAVPGYMEEHVFTPLEINVPKEITEHWEHHTQTYQMTYDGNSLICEILSGDSFLSVGGYYDIAGLYLRFTNPTAGTYQARQSLKIEGVTNGRTEVIREHDTNPAYCLSAVFGDLPPWEMIRPRGAWNDTIYLQDDISEYDTRAYTREILGAPASHTAYDSLKMTVPLPEGAIPFLRKDGKSIPLESGITYPVNDYFVSFYENHHYSNEDGSLQGNADLLVYELRSGHDFLCSPGYEIFSFGNSGTEELYLHFSDPQAGKYQSPASPKTEAVLQGRSIVYYDHSRTEYLSSVSFVTSQEGSNAYPDYLENYDSEHRHSGWSDSIQLDGAKTFYYTKPYERCIYSYPHSSAYDRVTMIVLLPDEATPGFGEEDNFIPLIDGTTYSMQQNNYYRQSWLLTYHAHYQYKDAEGNSGTAQALIYDLDPDSTGDNPFLHSSTDKTSFVFEGKETSCGKELCLRFQDPVPMIYSSAAAPKVDYWINGNRYTSSGYFEKTDCDTRVFSNALTPRWSYLSTKGDTNETTLDSFQLSSGYVLPKDCQDNKVFYGEVLNFTGCTLYDIKVGYTFEDELNADRLELYLGDAGYPSGATVTYTTRLNETEQHAELNVSNNILTLEDGNAFLTAEITYDTLENARNAQDYKRLLAVRIHNYYNLQDDPKGLPRKISSAPISAHSEWISSENHTFPQDHISIFRLLSRMPLSPSVSTYPATIKKGDTFKVMVSGTGIYKNLQLYLRMPKGYILTGYETPPDWGDAVGYTLTDRTIQNDDGEEEILYCVSFTDNVSYISNGRGAHSFSFRVGPEADTSRLQTDVLIPSAAYAAMAEDIFCYLAPESTKTEEDLGLDINGDSDRADSFYTFYPNKVTVLQLAELSTEGYISINGQNGADVDHVCRFYSHGNYLYTIHNGLDSDACAENGVFTICLHKEGDNFQYNATDYTSQYSVILEGPVSAEPKSDFLKDCTIEYSEDNVNWLREDQVAEYSKISHVRVSAAAGRQLHAMESAYISVPFSLAFPEDDTPMDGCKAYIDVQTEYDYSVGDETKHSTTQRLSTLTAESAAFSGLIYRDENWNGRQDMGESTRGKIYTLNLYSGESTEGELLQTIQTDRYGKFDFKIWLPGTYTLHLEKDEAESYGASRYFDEHGNYTFTLDNGTAEPVKSGLIAGILGNIEKPEFIIRPSAPDGKDNWYVTLPAITLRSQMPEGSVNTIFQRNEEVPQTLSANVRPSVGETGRFLFSAYNRAAQESIAVTSETATLDLKVDLDAPTFNECSFHAVAGTSSLEKIGNFLSFGNFFKEALRVTVTAEDIGSGLGALHYTLPGQQEQTVLPDANGQFQFNIPMDTVGIITYYAEDKAGNQSDLITLRKDNGSDLWMLEDKDPVWEDFVLADTTGDTGVQGADGSIWFAESVNVSARVRDEDSGLALISSRINDDSLAKQELTGDEKLTAYEFSVFVETEGVISIWAEAEDNAKNTAAAQTAFGIDKTAPTIVLEKKELMDGILTATVLIRDSGSGVDPSSIHVLWQGKDVAYQITPIDNSRIRNTASASNYQLTFSLEELEYADKSATLLVTAKDYTGWSAELAVTRYQDQIIYVAADTGSDVSGDGSRKNPVQTLEAALERVAPNGTIVLLEDYNGTACVNLQVKLDLNGKTLHADIPGSAVTVAPSGCLIIMDSNGSASEADGFPRDPESEGEVFGGIPGDPAFSLEGGVLRLTDGTIYCGYTGNDNVSILEDARMMYLLTYLNGEGTGTAPELHYIEENTKDALKLNTFTREGYSFHGWLYEDHLYQPGEEILMPGRNMEALAKWEKTINIPEPAPGNNEPNQTSENESSDDMDERGRLDQVPKTGNSETTHSQNAVPHADRLELYIETRKKEDEQSTEG